MTTNDDRCRLCAERQPWWVRMSASVFEDTEAIRVCGDCKRTTERYHRGAYIFVPIRDASAGSADRAAAAVDEVAEAMQGTLADVPMTGRVGRQHPETARAAAKTVNVVGQVEDIHARLVFAGDQGRLADELADAIGGKMSPNQVSTRLLDLWEGGRAAVARTHGFCVFGVCHPHDPSTGRRHLPQDACDRHGPVEKRKTSRKRAAAIWRALP